MSGNIIIRTAMQCDIQHVKTIVLEIESSANIRGSGINKRSPELIREKILNGEAIIAVTESNEWIGFCYIQLWDDGKFVANCGLIVSPAYRSSGIAKQIKK